MTQWIDQNQVAEISGMVIPAYFSSKPTDEMVAQLLWMTLGDCHRFLHLENVWVVVDGDPRTAGLLDGVRKRLRQEHGQTLNILSLPENRGKLWAIREGMRALLADRPAVAHVVVRDGDGDHGLADTPALFRAAMALTETYEHSRVIVLGARRSRHHPMGWVRGELETLLDQVTLDALAYALAREGRALNLRHCRITEAPDLSSGFKVYGRQMAQYLFVDHEPRLECLSPSDYWHLGPETVAVVEGVLAGAVLAEMQRLTWDGQPTTSFGEFKHLTLYGELLVWVYARLDLPLEVAGQLFDNHLGAMMLRTTHQGAETLSGLREYALGKLGQYRGEARAIPAPKPLLPFL